MIQAPVVSVVMTTYQGERWLTEQLDALSQQTLSVMWEIIIADNGSQDRSVEIARSYETRLPSLRLIDAGQKRGKQHAQRLGVRASRGELLAFVDQDDVCRPGWLAAIVSGLAQYDAVGGAMDLISLNSESTIASRPQADTGTRGLPEALSAGAYAPGGNMGITRAAWLAIDHPHADLPPAASAGEDKDLGFRLRRAGFSLGFIPDAVVAYRLRPPGRDLRKQMQWYGVADSYLVKRHREIGAMGDALPAVARKWFLLVPRAAKARLEQDDTHWARNELAVAIGRLKGSLRFRVWCL